MKTIIDHPQKYLLILVGFFVIQIGCTKTEYIIGKSEENIPDSTSNYAPGKFSVSVEKITDTEVQINWNIPSDQENDLKSFEIGINDSIIVYNLGKETSTYLIENLKSDTEYKISVVAVDKVYNNTTAETVVKTYKSFIKAIIRLDLKYEDCYLLKAIETSDGGFLMEGRGTINTFVSPHNDFIIKLKADYSIEWEKEYGEWYSSSDIYAPQSLLECSAGGYLVTHRQALTRLDVSGNIQWTSILPAEYESTLNSSNFDSAGDFISVGYSDRNWPDGPVAIEYFVMKTTSTGTEQWHKIGGQSITNYPKNARVLNDNSILITGTAESSGSTTYAQNHDWANSFWTLILNESGEELGQNLYPNEYHFEDILSASYLDPGGSLILMGAYAGDLPPYGYYNSFPRVLKVDLNGNVIWDIYPKLSKAYNFSSFRTYNITQDGNLLVLGTDDRGISLNLLAPGGNVSEIVSLRNFPSMLLLKNNPTGFYELISTDGYVVVCNKDGYIPEKNRTISIF